MAPLRANVGHVSQRLSILVLAPFLIITLQGTPVAADDNPIIRIEEDWEMVVDPDVNSTGPQVVCAMAPVCHLGGLHVTFELNHRSVPSSANGGLFLHVWDGDEWLGSKSSPDAKSLAIEDETITWTQRMDLLAGQISLEIVNGHSATWGDFGSQGNLKAIVTCGLTSLNQYTPTVSMKNSGVTYASHCVKALILRRVRAVRADGTIVPVELNYYVHRSDDH